MEIVCFFRGALRGGVRLIGAFSRNILELLLLSDFFDDLVLRFKKVPNSHVFLLKASKKTNRRQETCFSLVTDGFTKRSNRILTSYILGFATL